ncbi:peptidyl-prolyl cis-trans isomerase-like 4 [Salvelinus sp. IW2-2015]|uniref:peptidyl-prolyl cis-trans isomerase-like 4 n=1 Tax=Salvelinus sp. IW2-2015 TaxID=2691554 RepID=UPI000CEAC454|nr:peptidyl-prolyl cis-trans isomerase-like 4 [Salvelinus alpinus]
MSKETLLCRLEIQLGLAVVENLSMVNFMETRPASLMQRKTHGSNRKKGMVSMVNNGSDHHGSQFPITTGEVHTVLGEMSEGIGVLDKINDTFVDKDFIPFQDIRINHTVILEDTFDDPANLPVPDRSPEPTKEQLDSGRIGAEEVINDTDGKEAEELDELLKEEATKTQAILLEMVGDLPDAQVKPPENVLFACKLNPVTTNEDLEIIFSRFGLIKWRGTVKRPSSRWTTCS